MKCYLTPYGKDIITPVDLEYIEYSGESVTVHYKDSWHTFVGIQDLKPVKLKPYTTLNKIQLIPAILAAKMARLVRKVKNRKCTELENKLMRYYYEEEVRVRGYVE